MAEGRVASQIADEQAKGRVCRLYQVPLDMGGTLRVVAKSKDGAEKYAGELVDQWNRTGGITPVELEAEMSEPVVAVECWLEMARPPGRVTPVETAAWKARRKAAGLD